MTTNEQPTTIITSAGEKLTAQPAEPAKATANGSSRKPAGKVRTGNPAEDRAVRAASVKATSNGKAPARQSRAGRAAAQAKSDAKPAANARGAKATAAKAGTQAKAQPAKAGSAKPGPKPKSLTAKQVAEMKARKAEAEATKQFHEHRRQLFRAIVSSAGELVKEFPASERAALAQAAANQLHHLVRQDPKAKNGGWPGLLPRPVRSDWA